MDQLVSANEFLNYLKRHDLVIAPASMVQEDKRPKQAQALRKPALTYREISETGLWGDITQKRAYQLAKEYSRDGEILKPGPGVNSPEKIITQAVKRIAIQRGLDPQLLEQIKATGYGQ